MESSNNADNNEFGLDQSRDNLNNVDTNNQGKLHILEEQYNIKFLHICNFFESCIKAKAKSKIK
jgi:hypothetical protein